MFESLTKYVNILKSNNYGDYIEPEKDEKGVYIIHGVQYSRDVQKFIEEVYDFANTHPEFHHNQYSKILEDNCINIDDPFLYSENIKELESNIIFIILFSIIRKEHLDYFKETIGYILLFIVIAGISYLLSNLFIFENIWLTFIINIVVSCIIPNLFIFIIFKKSENYKYFTHLITKIKKRKMS